MDEMTLWAGSLRNEEIPVQVARLGAGAAETACVECDGTGVWTVLPIDGPILCTTCKGTGRMLVFGVSGLKFAYRRDLYGETAMNSRKPLPVWIALGLGLGTASIGLGLIVAMVVHTI